MSIFKLPNQLTILRIVLTPIFVWLILSDNPSYRLASGVVFLLALLTDFYDGYHARKYGIVSNIGAFLDPLADKILIGSGFFVLVFLDVISLWMTAIIIGRDIIVTLFRLYAEVKLISIKTSFSAKIKTLLQSVFLYVILICYIGSSTSYLNANTITFCSSVLHSPAVFWIMIGLTFLTLYTAIEYLIDNKFLFQFLSSSSNS